MIKTRYRSYFILVYFILVLSGMSAANAREHATVGSGELRLYDGSGSPHHSVLLSTDIKLDVTAMTARVRMRQTFSNPTQQWVNARYVFPLPETAAVKEMVMRVGDRVIRGKVQQREQAKQAFVKARESGKRAALVEVERQNLFTLSTANIAPGGTVDVELVYLQTVEYTDGEFSIRLPTTLTPRFIPGTAHPELDGRDAVLEHERSGWSRNTTEVPDASRVTPYQVTSAGESNRFTFSARLNAGLVLQQVSSPSHAINWHRISDQYQVEFMAGDDVMDRDLVLRWLPVPHERPRSAYFHELKNGNNYVTLMLMPPTAGVASTFDREVIFVIDSSGSMKGISMPQAKKSLLLALGRLSARDTFNIIDFDSTARKLFNTARPASAEELSYAQEFVTGLRADGGTNMAPALDLALQDAAPRGRLRQVIFITDGSVGNEQALFEKISAQIGDSRLFTVGIGSAPNTLFMRKAAQFGRGTFTYIDPGNSVQERMQTLFQQLERPALRDLEVDWGTAQDVEQLPPVLADLYYGQPLLVSARMISADSSVRIRGSLGGGQWEKTLRPGMPLKDSGLATLWAARKVDSLFDSMITGAREAEIKPQVMALALEHKLLTKYTSFVAIEERTVRPQGEPALDKQVPNLMPGGNTMAIPFPGTATSAQFSFYLGLIFLFCAFLFHYRYRVS